MDDLDDITEKELLLEIFRQVRWIGRFLAVMTCLAILGAGLAVLLSVAESTP